MFGPPSHPIGTILWVETTSWAVAQCPENYIAKRLLCAAPSVGAPAQAASDDLVTALPLPKPWVLKTAKNSPFIKSFHVETPLDLAAVLGFYRVELSKRGWTENVGAVVESDRAVIAFTTTDGPALLRLIHQDDRTIADLSLRKPGAVEETDILPSPGHVKLMLGNKTDEEAVITVNEQTFALAARAGRDLTNAGRKLPDARKSICRRASTRSPSRWRAARRRTGSSRSLPTRPGASWSVRLASRSPCTFIDTRSSELRQQRRRFFRKLPMARL
jgi:hypothetical protein